MIIQRLFSKDVSGKIRVWQIEPQTEGFIIGYGELDSIIQTKYIDVIPKSNRTMEQQIELELNSRISKQMDKGYTWDLDKAKTELRTNSLGFHRPMLAQRIQNVRNVDYTNSVIQRKYNGHRCLITNEAGILIAYSKNGKPITTISHILKDMQIPENHTIDGELYVHGELVQSISSLVKKQQPANLRLNFIAYDYISPDTYLKRLAGLVHLPKSPSWGVAETFNFNYGEEVDYMHRFVKEGYEGAIIRLDGYGYEDGKRSKCLIKVKPKYDDEFTVIDIEQSKDGWAILVCDLPEINKTFKVSAPGTFDEKHKIWRERDYYIGECIQVEYYELTKDKVPFHPIATYWRDLTGE